MEEIYTKSVNLSTEVSIGEIIDSIADGLDHDEIVKFIIALELDTADWDVTKKLYKYFERQMKILEKEERAENEK